MVISGLRRASTDELDTVKIINHGSIAALVRGDAARADWDHLNAAINMGLVLAEASQIGGYGHEYWGEMSEAQKALANVGRRFLQWGKWQITPVEETILSRAMAIHDAQLEAATVKDIELAQRQVWHRMTDPNKHHTVKALPAMFELKEAA